MTLQEFIYAFEVDYKLECLKRDVKEIGLNAKYKALMLSKVISDIQKKLGVIELTGTYDSVSGTSAYNISSKFMNPKAVKFGENVLAKTTTEWIKRQISKSGTPYKYAILMEGATAKLYLFPTPDTSETGNIYLQSNYSMGLYSPNAGSTQDFGVFDGSTFSGNLGLPQQYEQAVLLGMLKQIFKDIEPDYDREINLLKVLQYNGEKFEYEFNDYSEMAEESVPTTQTTITTTTSTGMDLPIKKLRFTAVSTGADILADESFGWTAEPTIANNVTSIVITSPDSELTLHPQVECSNEDFGWTQTGLNIITITPDPSTGWGEVEIIIEIYA